VEAMAVNNKKYVMYKSDMLIGPIRMGELNSIARQIKNKNT